MLVIFYDAGGRGRSIRIGGAGRRPAGALAARPRAAPVSAQRGLGAGGTPGRAPPAGRNPTSKKYSLKTLSSVTLQLQ